MMRGLAEYCIYTSISSHVRGCSHDFLLQDPSGLERSKGRTTHGGRPGSASSTSRTTRETSSSRSSLLAPACARPPSLPPFFPHPTERHRRGSPRYFPRPVHVLSTYCFSSSSFNFASLLVLPGGQIGGRDGGARGPWPRPSSSSGCRGRGT